jgi:hypothetical protein
MRILCLCAIQRGGMKSLYIVGERTETEPPTWHKYLDQFREKEDGHFYLLKLKGYMLN